MKILKKELDLGDAKSIDKKNGKHKMALLLKPNNHGICIRP